MKSILFYIDLILHHYTKTMWWWKQQIHISWLIAVASAFFVVGVALALVYKVHSIVGVIGFIVMVLGWWVARVYILPVTALASLALGNGYGGAHIAERSRYDQFIGSYVTVRGRIREDPSRSSSGSISLQLDSVQVNDIPMPGAVFVSVRSVRDIKRSDTVEVKGQVRSGFANFPISISAPNLSRVIRSPTADIGRVVRDWFADKVRQVIPEPQASLGIGYLTGQKSALPPDLSDALKIAGLTHIVVASGYNLTILVQLARKLFLRVSKYASAVSSLVMIGAFMGVTGLSPSMTRAGLVSSMSLAAWYYGHAFHPLILLPLAAAITIAFQPSYVWGDLGWQLSFAAFAGVMIVAPLLQAYFFGDAEPSTIRQILGETIAAHAVTVPVIALSFGVVSNVAIIANLLVVPFVPLAMLLTFICGIGVIASIPFIHLIAAPTSWLLEYMVNVAYTVAEIPWAQSELNIEGYLWGVYTLLLALACVYMYRKTNYNFRGT